MNVLVIPSWYPHAENLISGAFFKEQAKSFAELSPDDQVVVSVAGAGEYMLSPREIGDLIPTLSRFYRAPPLDDCVVGNFVELRRPVLEWSARLGGNLSRRLRAHRANLDEAIRRFGRIDLIHAHVAYPAGWVAMVLSRERRIPYVLSEHMGPFPFKNPRFIRSGRLRKWIARPIERAAKVAAVSPYLAKQIASFGLPEPRVIPNVVDERAFFPPKERKPHGAELTFLTVTGMVPGKGIEDLLRAIKLLAPGDHVRFVIAGVGPLAKPFSRLSTALGVDRWVRWLGLVPRDEMPDLMRSCDVFVLASHLETFGVVYAEAIACGRPVIATRCGGPESIVNRNNGVLVPVGEVEALASALRHMMREHRNYSVDVMREDFLGRFSRRAVVKELRRLYVEALGC